MKMRYATGVVADPCNLKPQEVFLWDIAWSLSNQNRFLGHTPVPWSVLSHTALALALARAETKGHINVYDEFGILIHDAPEAYVGDVPRPIKREPEMAAFERYESGCLRAILDRFNIKYDQIDWDVVKRYDNQALFVELSTFYPELASTELMTPAEYPMSSLPMLSVALPQHYIGAVQDVLASHNLLPPAWPVISAVPPTLREYLPALPSDVASGATIEEARRNEA